MRVNPTTPLSHHVANHDYYYHQSVITTPRSRRVANVVESEEGVGIIDKPYPLKKEVEKR